MNDDIPEWMALAPFQHQLQEFAQNKNKRNHAYRMEQGTGKTKVACDKSIHLFLENKIDAMVVVTLNGVHRNWIEREVPKHFAKVPFKVKTLLWRPGKTKKFEEECKAMLEPDAVGARTMRIVAINLEALRRKNSGAEKFLRKFLPKFRSHMIVDESSHIKTPTAAQSRRTRSLGRLADCRSTLTGTMITQGPFDAYSQFDYLKVGALGFDTYTAFKGYYAEIEDQPIPGAPIDPKTGKPPTHQVVAKYKNMDVLKERMDAMSSIWLKKDCLDLPDKVYEPPRYVDMTPEQARLYAEARTEILVWLEEHQHLTIRNCLSRMLRLSQITGGFLPSDEDREAQPIEGGNPKVDGMLNVIEELEPDAKVIVWARFVPELRLIAQELRNHFGGRVSRWWGEIKEDVRSVELDCFMNDPARRFWVGQPHSGGFGVTLTAASHVIYFSNDFSYEARAQSEDRAHRIGQVNKVTYWDLVVPRSIDEKVLAVLGVKKEMAGYFSSPKELARWIEE
jgi:SNF2 family DNA or RNA helicase